MRANAIRLAGLAASVLSAGFIAWLLATQPQTIADVSGGLAASVGLYQIDQASFEQGRNFFHADKFPEARLAFSRADPAGRDATTQFYVAYSFYRQGWGRFYNDDALFKEGMNALDRAVASAPGGVVVVNDERLGLHSADELHAEL